MSYKEVEIRRQLETFQMATLVTEEVEEAEGFEPSSPAKGCQFSRLVHSTALPRFRCVYCSEYH
jgi:hypothetical protein